MALDNNLILNKIIQIEANVDQVWDALVNPEKIKKYMFGADAVSDFKKGSKIVFKGVWEGQPYEEKGIITAVEPLKKLEYKFLSSFSGMEDRPENYSLLTFQISPTTEKNQATLTLTQVGFTDEKSKESSEQNWVQVLHGIQEVAEQQL